LLIAVKLLSHPPVEIQETIMHGNPRVAVIIVAAGNGVRASVDGREPPKQYRLLGGTPVVARSIGAFSGHPAVVVIQPVIGADHKSFYDALGLADAKLAPPVWGGRNRQASVLAGLEALAETAPDLVLIHDAARPLVPAQTIDSVLGALVADRAALPVLPVSDTIKHASAEGYEAGTRDRTHLRAAQTPQGFVYADILSAHRRMAGNDVFTDDAAIAHDAGIPVKLVQGDRRNIKLTEPGDFALAEWYLGGATMVETRTGTGLDVHRFTAGDSVRLAEVDIPHTASLAGHSDADAALHVLTDALLGALGEGDIGTHFPPSEDRWKGEPSRTFLSFAAARVRARGGRIVHLDLTLMSEAPRIGPYAATMRTNIAAICGISASRVSVKATTSERMGFIGRGEGLFAHGTANVELPNPDAAGG